MPVLWTTSTDFSELITPLNINQCQAVLHKTSLPVSTFAFFIFSCADSLSFGPGMVDVTERPVCCFYYLHQLFSFLCSNSLLLYCHVAGVFIPLLQCTLSIHLTLKSYYHVRGVFCSWGWGVFWHLGQ